MVKKQGLNMKKIFIGLFVGLSISFGAVADAIFLTEDLDAQAKIVNSQDLQKPVNNMPVVGFGFEKNVGILTFHKEDGSFIKTTDFMPLVKGNRTTLIGVAIANSSLNNVAQKYFNVLGTAKEYKIALADLKKECSVLFLSYRLKDSKELTYQTFFLDHSGSLVDKVDKECPAPTATRSELIEYTNNGYIAGIHFEAPYLSAGKETKIKVILTKDGEDFFPYDFGVYAVNEDFTRLYHFNMKQNVAGPYFGTTFLKDLNETGNYYFVVRIKETAESVEDYVIIKKPVN
jgi:hypothetical protein